MPSTYTTRNRLEKQAAGENSNTWGTRLNTNVIDLLDAAADGMTSFTLSGTKTLTTADGSADEARTRFLNVTGGTGGTITIPNAEKLYFVRNDSSGDVTVSTATPTASAVVKSGNVAWVACDGAASVFLALSPNFNAANITTTGTITGGALSATTGSFSSDLTVSGQINGSIGSRLTGSRTARFENTGGSAATGSTGIGLEIAGNVSSKSRLTAYDRTGSAYVNIQIDGNEIELRPGGVLAALVTSTAFSCPSSTTASAANLYQASSGSALLRSTSSLRYKTNVLDLANAEADKVLQLRPVTYTSKAEADDPARVHWGFIAEETDAVLPSLVHYAEDESGNLVPDGMQYERVVVGLLNVVKRLEARVASLEARIV